MPPNEVTVYVPTVKLTTRRRHLVLNLAVIELKVYRVLVLEPERNDVAYGQLEGNLVTDSLEYHGTDGPHRAVNLYVGTWVVFPVVLDVQCVIRLRNGAPYLHMRRPALNVDLRRAA